MDHVQHAGRLAVGFGQDVFLEMRIVASDRNRPRKTAGSARRNRLMPLTWTAMTSLFLLIREKVSNTAVKMEIGRIRVRNSGVM